ncbi:MAG: SPOUT family RNA methylase [Candidatus Methanomethylicia archaeon]
MDLFIKTQKGLEEVAASHIIDVLGNVKVVTKPNGFLGIILADDVDDKYNAVKIINENIPEVEYAYPIEAEVKSVLEEIVNTSVRIAKERIVKNESFAIRTTRRGKHNFSSIDVNIKAGALIREAVGSDVDLTSPDKIVYIEILGDKTYIMIGSGREFEEFKKRKHGKKPILEFLRRLSIVQIPYTGPLNAVYAMGVRIGRAVQTFEVNELVVSPKEKISADEVDTFIKGVFEGIKSRYEVQQRTYRREVHKVPVYIQDLYQLVRERRNEYLISTSTRGYVISRISNIIDEAVKSGKKISILIGAREGLPTGVLRLSRAVLDLSPGVTISTDFACVAALIAFITHIEEKTHNEM